MNKVLEATQNAHKWLEQTRGQLNSSVRHLPPPITCAQIRTEHQNFEQTISPILNKPVPKPPAPPKEEKNSGDNPPPQQTASQEQTEQPPQQPPQDESNPNMDWY